MKKLSIILVSLILTSCIATAPKRAPVPVEAGYLYEGGYINLRSPNSDGWHLVSSSPAGMEFARFGSNKNESFGAQLLMFSLPITNNKEEFISLIEKSIQADTDKTRFKVISSELTYTESRGYPCVEIESVVNDKQAKIQGDMKKSLLLQSISLYCRHPVRTDTGFSAIYSHRGPSIYEQLRKEALAYIEGVQVPDNAQ